VRRAVSHDADRPLAILCSPATNPAHSGAFSQPLTNGRPKMRYALLTLMLLGLAACVRSYTEPAPASTTIVAPPPPPATVVVPPPPATVVRPAY
jgi:hypothetical protein